MKKTSEVTHTPGPWSNTPGQDTIWANDGDLKVARVSDLPWIENSSGRRSSDWMTENANARLIAAAPSLLSALENLLKMVEDGDYTTIELDEAREALKKARGQ